MEPVTGPGPGEEGVRLPLGRFGWRLAQNYLPEIHHEINRLMKIRQKIESHKAAHQNGHGNGQQGPIDNKYERFQEEYRPSIHLKYRYIQMMNSILAWHRASRQNECYGHEGMIA